MLSISLIVKLMAVGTPVVKLVAGIAEIVGGSLTGVTVKVKKAVVAVPLVSSLSLTCIDKLGESPFLLATGIKVKIQFGYVPLKTQLVVVLSGFVVLELLPPAARTILEPKQVITVSTSLIV